MDKSRQENGCRWKETRVQCRYQGSGKEIKEYEIDRRGEVEEMENSINEVGGNRKAIKKGDVVDIFIT